VIYKYEEKEVSDNFNNVSVNIYIGSIAEGNVVAIVSDLVRKGKYYVY
jgi:hypothetical protein